MKAPIKIFFYLIIFAAPLFPQVKTDTSKTENQKPNYIKYLLPSYNEFNIYNKLFLPDAKNLVDQDPNTIWLWTSVALSNNNSPNNQFQKNSYQIISPLVQLYLDKSKISPMQYILGLVQYGAVGYLAYQHIKKYGFLK